MGSLSSAIWAGTHPVQLTIGKEGLTTPMLQTPHSFDVQSLLDSLNPAKIINNAVETVTNASKATSDVTDAFKWTAFAGSVGAIAGVAILGYAVYKLVEK